jgi:hypothetical protein
MRTVRRVFFASAVTAALVFSSPAGACSLVPYKASNYRIETRAIPEMMVASAATVDVVIAESVDRSAVFARFDVEEAEQLAQATSDDERAEIRADFAAFRDQWRRSGAGTVTYRVVERLKGASADTFSLNAFVPLEDDPDFPQWLLDTITKRGAFLDPKSTWALRQRDLGEWGGLGSCASPLFAVLGLHYLVFRDAEGHLLTDGISLQVKVDGKFVASTRDGPAYEHILLDGDPWLEAVRAAAHR